MAEALGQGGEVQSQWVRVRARLRAEYGDAAYRSWLRNMSLQGIEEGRAKIAVPTRFLRDWVAAHYADRIRALWSGENGAIAGIDIFVNNNAPIAETVPALVGAKEQRDGVVRDNLAREIGGRDGSGESGDDKD